MENKIKNCSKISIKLESAEFIAFEVENVNGSSKARFRKIGRKYGSFKNLYSERTEIKPNLCCVEGCSNPFEDGSHIRIIGFGKKQYIAPFCHKHNMENIILKLKQGTVLAILNIDDFDIAKTNEKNSKESKNKQMQSSSLYFPPISKKSELEYMSTYFSNRTEFELWKQLFIQRYYDHSPWTFKFSVPYSVFSESCQ